MIAGHDLANFILRQQVLVGHAGLVVDEGDGILVVLALERKQSRHHPKGKIAAHVGGVVVTASHALHRANHFERDVIQDDACTHGWTSRKQVLDEFIAQHDDVASLRFVQIVEPAPLIEREVADLAELGFDACDLAVGAGKLTDRAHIRANENRRSIANVRSFFADVDIILIGKQVSPPGAHVALHHRSPPGIDEHDVFAVLRQLAFVARAETFSQAHQQKQGSHAPRDTEHGKERAQFVRPERAEDLREDVQNHSHGTIAIITYYWTEWFALHWPGHHLQIARCAPQ